MSFWRKKGDSGLYWTFYGSPDSFGSIAVGVDEQPDDALAS
eukprot:CAMPEP_0201493746 /NCGR_PEP_ID=MMETSP0151_2-20130828/41355_1 /ASSEMBLY_ACC=CAM_ASM_000257 /TAXON_ID=200890 /ORGANISM="Paramoeba atlantica, Strain 621/1 / CCAP 1560/9" /LENGTH=40 /DNA_ID= /DNA_START= /DNA_END= /DNA_ORIENTATION=